MSYNIQASLYYQTIFFNFFFWTELYSSTCLFLTCEYMINLQIVQNNTDFVEQDIPLLKIYV